MRAALGNAQAAHGIRQLARIDENVDHRRAIAGAYRRALVDADVVLPAEPEAGQTAYVRFPVRVRDRETTVKGMASLAVLGRWFTSVLGESASPAAGGYETGSCPNAEIAGRDLVNLPTHDRVTTSDAVAIAAALAEAQRPTAPPGTEPAPLA